MAIVATIAFLPFIVIALVNIAMTRPKSPRLNQVVENYMARYPIIAAGLAGFVGALAGHIFWATGTNPNHRVDFPDFKLLYVALGLGIALGGFGAGALAILGSVLKPLMCPSPSAILSTPSRTLDVGAQLSLCVRAHCYWNDTELDVKQGEEYSVTASGEWWDWIFPSDAGGYQPPRWSIFQTLTARWRRLPRENWFTLGAQLLPDDGHCYQLGGNRQMKMESTGRLILFANDARGFYWNNWGSISVTIQCLSKGEDPTPPAQPQRVPVPPPAATPPTSASPPPYVAS